MTRKEALEALLVKVEAGSLCGPDSPNVINHETSKMIDVAVSNENWDDLFNAYDGSLDAAKALHEAVLPGWEYGYDGSIAWVKLPGLRTYYRHDSLGGYTAHAWLIALLRALIAMEEAVQRAVEVGSPQASILDAVSPEEWRELGLHEGNILIGDTLDRS